MTTGMDVAQLGNFSPFSALKSTNLTKMLDEVEVREASPGQALLNKGDTDKRTMYVLSGTITLRRR